MADTDLSKIVSLIMENPALIEQIRSLTDRNSESAPTEDMESTDEKDEKITEEEKSEPVSLPISPKKSAESIRRKELLCALKPYVSEGRSRAIDSIISIAEILDVIKR